MADEELAIAPALETPASDEQQQIETELGTGDDQQLEGGEDGDDEDELDFGFEKYRVPKKLKEAVEALRADATNKHQTAAARQKALDDREAAVTQQAEATDAEIDAKADLRVVSKRLADYEKLTDEDWQYHSDQDPKGAQDHWRIFQSLKNQKAELEGTLGKAATERTEKAQQDLAKRVQQTLTEAPKFIPGFKPEIIGKLADFAFKDMGIPEGAIKNNWSPTFLKLLHRAYIGEQTLSRPAQKAPAPTPEPLKIVAAKGNPSPTALSDNLSAEEWVRRRNAQLKKRAN
jgi:hypothetical protein